jgi:hypothetical protein
MWLWFAPIVCVVTASSVSGVGVLFLLLSGFLVKVMFQLCYMECIGEPYLILFTSVEFERIRDRVARKVHPDVRRTCDCASEVLVPFV